MEMQKKKIIKHNEIKQLKQSERANNTTKRI